MFKKGCKTFVTCYIVACKKKKKNPAFRPQTTTCASAPKDTTLAVEQTWTHKSKAPCLRRGFHPDRVPTARRLIYDLFAGSTNHDETLNSRFSGPIAFGLGDRAEEREEVARGREGRRKKNEPH